MLTTLEDRRDYYRRLRSAAWTATVLGLFFLLVPLIGSLSIQEGRFGFLSIGAAMLVIGIISARNISTRIEMISEIIDPEGLLTRWKDSDFGETLITKKGLFYNGDIIPIDTPLCRIEEAEFKRNHLYIDYSVPKGGSRTRFNLDIAVPLGFEEAVVQFTSKIKDQLEGKKTFDSNPKPNID